MNAVNPLSPPYAASAAQSSEGTTSSTSTSGEMPSCPDSINRRYLLTLASAPLSLTITKTQVSADPTTPWLLRNVSNHDLHVLLKAAGEAGEFFVNEIIRNDHSNVQAELTLWLNAPGMSRSYKFACSSDGSGSWPGIIRYYDHVNEEVTLTWVDRQTVKSRRFSSSQVFPNCPRLYFHPTSIPIIHHNDGFRLNSTYTPTSFPTLPALISHLQTKGFLRQMWQRDGEPVLIKLKHKCICWSLRECDFPNKSYLRNADAKLVLSCTQDEVDTIFSGHWCQPGDFILRFADPSLESEREAIFAVSVMSAIRILHRKIYLNKSGLFYLERSPELTFFLLSDLLDYVLIHEKISGIPLRRLVNVGNTKVLIGEDTSLRRIPKYSRPTEVSNLWRGLRRCQATDSEHPSLQQPQSFSSSSSESGEDVHGDGIKYHQSNSSSSKQRHFGRRSDILKQPYFSQPHIHLQETKEERSWDAGEKRSSPPPSTCLLKPQEKLNAQSEETQAPTRSRFSQFINNLGHQSESVIHHKSTTQYTEPHLEHSPLGSALISASSPSASPVTSPLSGNGTFHRGTCESSNSLTLSRSAPTSPTANYSNQHLQKYAEDKQERIHQVVPIVNQVRSRFTLPGQRAQNRKMSPSLREAHATLSATHHQGVVKRTVTSRMDSGIIHEDRPPAEQHYKQPIEGHDPHHTQRVPTATSDVQENKSVTESLSTQQRQQDTEYVNFACPPDNKRQTAIVDTFFSETIPDAPTTGHPGSGMKSYAQLFHARVRQNKGPSLSESHISHSPYLISNVGLNEKDSPSRASSSESLHSHSFLNALASSNIQDEIDDIFG